MFDVEIKKKMFNNNNENNHKKLPSWKYIGLVQLSANNPRVGLQYAASRHARIQRGGHAVQPAPPPPPPPPEKSQKYRLSLAILVQIP